MFWRENKEQNGGHHCGHVRVLVVGDSGVGKTSLVHLIVKGFSVARPSQTVGCTVGVKHVTYGSPASSSSSIKGDSERDFLLNSGMSLDMNCIKIVGHCFIHKSMRRTKNSLQKWAVEVATTGTFSAPLGSGGPGGLPIPYLVIGNKADIAAKEGSQGSSGNLVDVARHWVEKQGLLPSSEELPLTESFFHSGGLIAAAKEARYDKEAIMKFFHMLIRRRYTSDEIPAPNPWSISPVRRPSQRLHDSLGDDDESFYKNRSLTGEEYKYNSFSPLPAQHNLTPPPTLYPQQPVPSADKYKIPRFSIPDSSRIGSIARSKRTDINV